MAMVALCLGLWAGAGQAQTGDAAISLGAFGVQGQSGVGDNTEPSFYVAGPSLEYQSLWAPRWAWTVFGDQSAFWWDDENYARLGGGLGLRHYFSRRQSLAGPFFESHLLAYHGQDLKQNVFGVQRGSFSLYGIGLATGWQFSVGRHAVAAVAARYDVLLADTFDLYAAERYRVQPCLQASLGWRL
jgi:hypothetical protein